MKKYMIGLYAGKKIIKIVCIENKSLLVYAKEVFIKTDESLSHVAWVSGVLTQFVVKNKLKNYTLHSSITEIELDIRKTANLKGKELQNSAKFNLQESLKIEDIKSIDYKWVSFNSHDDELLSVTVYAPKIGIAEFINSTKTDTVESYITSICRLLDKSDAAKILVNIQCNSVDIITVVNGLPRKISSKNLSSIVDGKTFTDAALRDIKEYIKICVFEQQITLEAAGIKTELDKIYLTSEIYLTTDSIKNMAEEVNVEIATLEDQTYMKNANNIIDDYAADGLNYDSAFAVLALGESPELNSLRFYKSRTGKVLSLIGYAEIGTILILGAIYISIYLLMQNYSTNLNNLTTNINNTTEQIKVSKEKLLGMQEKLSGGLDINNLLKNINKDKSYNETVMNDIQKCLPDTVSIDSIETTFIDKGNSSEGFYTEADAIIINGTGVDYGSIGLYAISLNNIYTANIVSISNKSSATPKTAKLANEGPIMNSDVKVADSSVPKTFTQNTANKFSFEIKLIPLKQ